MLTEKIVLPQNIKVSVDVAIQELGSISETGETFLILINFY